jgi:hypothetical protein
MRPSDLHNLEDECRREVNMRRAVFDKKVRSGGMDRRQADYQIAQMERLVVLIEALQHEDTTLHVRVSPNHIAVLQPEQISDWLADPAAFGRAFAKDAPAPRLINGRYMPALEGSTPQAAQSAVGALDRPQAAQSAVGAS